MNWPQLTVIALTALGFGITLANHGKPREPYNIGVHAVSIAITYSLLYAGGFFTTTH